MKEGLLQIIHKYGINHQQRKLNEEVFELQEAIIKYKFAEDDNKAQLEFLEEDERWNLDFFENHIVEELSDCYVMLKQFQYYYGITDEEIEKEMQFKINRQIERIENGD